MVQSQVEQQWRLCNGVSVGSDSVMEAIAAVHALAPTPPGCTHLRALQAEEILLVVEQRCAGNARVQKEVADFRRKFAEKVIVRGTCGPKVVTLVARCRGQPTKLEQQASDWIAIW